MPHPSFTHYDLELLNPKFDSPLVDILTDLEKLRNIRLHGTTPEPVFLQLKAIFHMLESLGSARIEGNNTTLADFVESRIVSQHDNLTDHLREMKNIEEGMCYIEENFSNGQQVTAQFIRELHAMTVQSLVRDGDQTPGSFRTVPVQISQSQHLPPDALTVPGYIDELLMFINRSDPRKYDLIKCALVHHRFAWIHPFRNGNGRVVRLLTYAMLIKYGFNVDHAGRILNPTAVFCSNRDLYYSNLADADTGTPESLEAWCVYVLQGISDELTKVNNLADLDYLNSIILAPALRDARTRGLISSDEAQILLTIAYHGVAKVSTIQKQVPSLSSRQLSYQIRKLVDRGLLQPISDNARQYTVRFAGSEILRHIIAELAKNNFIPPSLMQT